MHVDICIGANPISLNAYTLPAVSSKQEGKLIRSTQAGISRSEKEYQEANHAKS